MSWLVLGGCSPPLSWNGSVAQHLLPPHVQTLLFVFRFAQSSSRVHGCCLWCGCFRGLILPSLKPLNCWGSHQQHQPRLVGGPEKCRFCGPPALRNPTLWAWVLGAPGLKVLPEERRSGFQSGPGAGSRVPAGVGLSPWALCGFLTLLSPWGKAT